MDNEVALLQAAARDEHAAVIQYLRHAYMIGEGEEACGIEATAREEMRHFWVLSRWIVRLGGEPTIERGFLDLEGHSPAVWMERDVQAEERAIAMYREILAKVGDPALRADIARILSDEEAHHGEFAHLADKFRQQAEMAAAEEAAAPAEEPAPSPDEVEALAWGVSHEYAAILQYLLQSFLIRDEEVSRQLELQAINEMQHMGWLAEGLVERGREMPLEPHAVERGRHPADMLHGGVALERGTTDRYDEFIQRLPGSDLVELLERIREHEIYHEDLFRRLLGRLERLAPPGWTVGSLKKEE